MQFGSGKIWIMRTKQDALLLLSRAIYRDMNDLVEHITHHKGVFRFHAAENKAGKYYFPHPEHIFDEMSVSTILSLDYPSIRPLIELEKRNQGYKSSAKALELVKQLQRRLWRAKRNDRIRVLKKIAREFNKVATCTTTEEARQLRLFYTRCPLPWKCVRGDLHGTAMKNLVAFLRKLLPAVHVEDDFFWSDMDSDMEPHPVTDCKRMRVISDFGKEKKPC